tara:strand:- start:1308 stop:2774 length:1467 start_codon:yes stop_codon:yes gene_type:complete
MKILHKYIFKEHLVPFLMSLSVMALILLAQFLLKNMDKFLGKGLPLTLLFELIFYNMAWVVALAVPMAILISTLMAFGRMSADNEITAIRASGITYFSMLNPALIFAISISIFMIYFNNWILPDMNHKARNLISNITKTNPTIFFKSGKLHDEIDGYIFYFDKEGDGKDKFEESTIIKYDKRNILQTIISKHAELIDDNNDEIITIGLKDGNIYEPLKNSNEYRIIRFNENIIRLNADEFSFNRKKTRYRGDRELTFDSIKSKISQLETKISNHQINIKNEMLAIDTTLVKHIYQNPNLQKYLNNHGILHNEIINSEQAIQFIENLIKKLPAKIDIKNDNGNIKSVSKSKFKRSLKRSLRSIKHDKSEIEKKVKSKNKYEVELHKKFSLSIAGIVFVLVGAPLGIIARRGKFSISIAISLIFFLIYWAFLIAGEDFADKGQLNPAFAMWLPNIILLIIGFLLNLKIISNKKIIFTNFSTIKGKFIKNV